MIKLNYWERNSFLERKSNFKWFYQAREGKALEKCKQHY